MFVPTSDSSEGELFPFCGPRKHVPSNLIVTAASQSYELQSGHGLRCSLLCRRQPIPLEWLCDDVEVNTNCLRADTSAWRTSTYK